MLFSSSFNPHNNNMRWVLLYSRRGNWDPEKLSLLIPPTRLRIRICRVKTWLQNPSILIHCRIPPFIISPSGSFRWLLFVPQNSVKVSYLQNKFSNCQPRLRHFCIDHAPKDGSYDHHILICILNIHKFFLKIKLQAVLHKFSTVFCVWQIAVNISYIGIYCMIFEHAE